VPPENVQVTNVQAVDRRRRLSSSDTGTFDVTYEIDANENNAENILDTVNDPGFASAVSSAVENDLGIPAGQVTATASAGEAPGDYMGCATYGEANVRCNRGDPDFDSEGDVCANDNTPDEAICTTVQNGDFLCVVRGCLTTDPPPAEPTDPPTDPPTDEADDSFEGPSKFDQAKWGPLSDYVVSYADAGKDSTPHHYVYTNLGESCHHACMRKSPPGETWYCDDQSLFNVDGDENKRSDQIMNDDCDPDNAVGETDGPQDCEGRCTNPDDATNRSISRNKSAWAPYIRNDGKCFYAHFKGKHKCYIPRSNNYRLCGCQSYNDAVGEDYEPNMNIVEGDGSTGWHIVSDRNCNNHCDSLGLTCNAAVLNEFKGAYDMRALEELLTDGALGMCDMWDDRLVKKKNPAYRDTDKRCYVNPVDANGDAACNLLSRSPDTRFCYCGDAMA